MFLKRPFSLTLLAALLCAFAVDREDDGGTSGAALLPEETAYDVEHYDLSLRVDPATRTIDGTLVMTARVVRPTDAIVMNLDQRLSAHAVTSEGQELESRHRYGRLTIRSDTLFAAAGAEFRIAVRYGGTPREAPRPPWDGGFTWATTPSGKPWIATSCQGEGADLWWPCKDQPSDEPESFDLHINVPQDLVVASNGHLVTVDPVVDGWHTYHWRVSTPINNYGVALNIAPYTTLHTEYESVSGEIVPLTFWVLPENVEQGRELFPQFAQHLRFFEELYGPYPFRADKYGVAETPHMGMEHQTIIAYGNQYKGNPWGEQWGFDALHLHELAHEWWANLVTARNWKDLWIHEAFATYSQALYVEKLHGREAYKRELDSLLDKHHNRGAVAPRDPRSSAQMYFTAAETAPDNDVYYKGAWILHTLRYLIGDEAFFASARRMCYPDPQLEKTSDGSACRSTDTEEFRSIVEGVAGVDLAWFFEVYLRQPELPILVQERDGDMLHLAWRTPRGLAFPMPLPVRIDGVDQRLEMLDGTATLELTGVESLEIDPEGLVLMQR